MEKEREKQYIKGETRGMGLLIAVNQRTRRLTWLLHFITVLLLHILLDLNSDCIPLWIGFVGNPGVPRGPNRGLFESYFLHLVWCEHNTHVIERRSGGT